MKNTGLILGVLGLASVGLLVATAAKRREGGEIVLSGEAPTAGGTSYTWRVITAFPGSPVAYLGQFKLAGFGQFDNDVIQLSGDNATELASALKDAIAEIA